MVELDWRVESRAGVSLVELVVRNPTATARRVRVGNRLDGPVWPPRREGVPAVGWDDGGFEGVVGPGDRRTLGYASPAPPAEPPAELVWTERAGESERGATRDSDALAGEATPEGVVRALGDPRPPADAVPSSDAIRSATEPDVSIPELVESWLSNVEDRAERGPDSPPEPAPEDRPALASLARRIRRLRGEGSRPRPPSESRDSRRSR